MADLALGPGESTPSRRPPWLAEGYEAPWWFWKQVGRELLDAAPGTPRSAVFEWYNLFHELGQRHALGGRAAFSDYNVATGLTAASYGALTARAQRLAARWVAAGVQPGSTVCICLGPSPAYVASMLAAWLCGAAVSIVPPDGPGFVGRCVRALNAAAGGADGAEPPPAEEPPPLFAVVGSRARPWLSRDRAVRLLDWDDRGGPWPPGGGPTPHRFAAGEVAARYFSPLGAGWDQLVELSAEQLYLGALRDGLLLLGLGAGRTIAAPGFCSVQYKPALLVAALACGAHYLEFDMEELGDGSALCRSPLDVIAVRGSVRRLLSQRLAANEKAAPRRWLRNIAEDNDSRAWSTFAAQMAARGALGMSYFACSAAGGSLLFSAWCKDPVATGVWRTPGVPAELTEPNGTRMPALADVGMLTPLANIEDPHGIQAGLSDQALGRCVIARGEEADVWIENLGSHREGQVLPELQMEELLKAACEDVSAAVLASLPTHSGASRSRVVLLVYVVPSAAPPPDPAWLKQQLRSQLGADRLPDTVEVFELNPRWVDPKSEAPEVDRPGCASQYLTGTLWGKSRHQVFRELARLSREVRQVRAYKAEQGRPSDGERADGAPHGGTQGAPEPSGVLPAPSGAA